MRTGLVLTLVAALCAEDLLAQRKKRKKKGEEEEITQVLETPKDPPAAVPGETHRLGFLAAPLSSKGLLSQQVKDGLRALRSQARGAAILKVRAFVAGTGDLRRVQAIVSEEFTEWKLAIPAVSAIRVGALPQEGAQVVLEAVTQERKAIHPHGLAFFSGQQVTSKEALEKVEPLIVESLDRLAKAAHAVGVEPAAMLRVSCFSSSLGDHAAQRQAVAAKFPKAAATIMQTLRGLSAGLVECEGTGSPGRAPGDPMEAVNPDGLDRSPNYSQVMLVNAPKVILTGTQQAFRDQPSDVRLAFERLKRSVEASGGSLERTVMANYYPLTGDIMAKIRQLRFEFLDKARPPASTMLLFEGLPSMEASFAVEVITLP